MPNRRCSGLFGWGKEIMNCTPRCNHLRSTKKALFNFDFYRLMLHVTLQVRSSLTVSKHRIRFSITNETTGTVPNVSGNKRRTVRVNRPSSVWVYVRFSPGNFVSGHAPAVFRTQQILNSDVGFASSIVKNWRAPNVPRTKYPGLTLPCSHQL